MAVVDGSKKAAVVIIANSILVMQVSLLPLLLCRSIVAFWVCWSAKCKPNLLPSLATLWWAWEDDSVGDLQEKESYWWTAKDELFEKSVSWVVAWLVMVVMCPLVLFVIWALVLAIQINPW